MGVWEGRKSPFWDFLTVRVGVGNFDGSIGCVRAGGTLGLKIRVTAAN